MIGVLVIVSLAAAACGGSSKESDSADASTGGSDETQVEALIRGFSDRTQALDADGSYALLCDSLQKKSDLKQIRQNMEGYKNVGNAAPKISDLKFSNVTTNGSSGEARYSYTQVFRGETKTINEGVTVAKEQGKWCIKDQLAVDN
ncbi:MAG: hypothetical protein AB7P33_17565 [Dehalococcoidia bacterium]